MPLKITDGMGAWIDDFKKSDAPQFKGKSEKERRDMAIAAYLSAKRESVKEATTFEVDIEGLPKMYIKDKSPGAVKAKLRGIVKQPSMIQGVDRVTDAELKKTYRDKAQGREEEDMNAAKHYKSSMSEQVEQIDESDSKQKYKDRAKEAKKAGDHVGYHANMHDYYQGHADARTSGGAGNTIKNMQKARFHKQELQYYRAKAKNATNEEAEQIDELSPNTLKQYHGKAAADLNAKRDKMSKGTLTTTDHKKGQKRVTGLNRAASKMEEVELDENTMTVDIDHTGGHDPVAKKHGIKLKRTGNYSHNATGKKKNLQKYLAHHYDSHSDAKEIHPEVYKEEVEEVNEISKKTLGSYINKATTSVADAGYNSNDQDPARRKRGINTYVKRRKGIDKAVDRLTKESANLDRILSLLSKGDKK